MIAVTKWLRSSWLPNWLENRSVSSRIARRSSYLVITNSLIEPERRVTDWGRSERVEGLVDATLYEFLYHYWFRCEVEGIENVPSTENGRNRCQEAAPGMINSP